MFVLGNFFSAAAYLLDIFLMVMSWLILIRVIISWVNADPFNPLVQFLHRTTEPVLEPIRRFMPPMGFDLSPLIVLLVIIFLRKFLVATLLDLSVRLQ